MSLKIGEEKAQNKSIVAAIKYGMSKYSVSPEQLSLAMREHKVTLYRRFNHPEDFTLEELRAISAKIHIPLEKLINGETQ